MLDRVSNRRPLASEARVPSKADRISPVSVIPPIVSNNHSFIYHRRNITLATESVFKQEIILQVTINTVHTNIADEPHRYIFVFIFSNILRSHSSPSIVREIK
jgi:hypothetical protein